MDAGTNGTTAPQCTLSDEGKCTKSGGQWIDGQCKCEPDVSGAHWDIANKTCVCNDQNQQIKDGKCVTPAKCPDDAEGTPPNCTCKDHAKEYINGACADRCNTKVATYQDGKCVCKNTEQIYDENKKICECPSGQTEASDGKCVEPTQCPDDATGNYPNCKCQNEKIYNNKENTCDCPSDKPADKDGNCVEQLKCPADSTGEYPNCNCNDEDKRYSKPKNQCIEDELKKKQKAYEEAKAKEQSFENRMLTAVTTAATGIGGMELAQGLAEQKSDKAADADMTAYIETMRCTYGDGKQVKAGPDEIELPGANNQELMNLRGQYLALAQDLKERKTALGMKPGIESETILDRASTGLYDDETIGINNGAYASLYRAKMLESEEDQKKIDDAASTSKKRVTGGAIAAGAGVVVGIAGNAIVNNSKLGENLKGAVKDKKAGKETQKLLEKEEKALKDLRACLKSAGVKDADDLTFTEFYPSVLSAKKINCGKLKTNQNLSVDDMFADSTNATEVYNKLKDSFDTDTITKLIGYDTSNDSLAIRKIQSSIESVQDDFRNARDKDEKSASGLGIDLSDIKIDGDGISSISSLFGGDILSNITGGK